MSKGVLSVREPALTACTGAAFLSLRASLRAAAADGGALVGGTGFAARETDADEPGGAAKDFREEVLVLPVPGAADVGLRCRGVTASAGAEGATDRRLCFLRGSVELLEDDDIDEELATADEGRSRGVATSAGAEGATDRRLSFLRGSVELLREHDIDEELATADEGRSRFTAL